MKKKVGILTFHNTRNAGAALQSYALEKILSNQDVTVKVINYQNENINSRYAIKKLSEIKQGKELIKYILSNKYVIKRQALFSDFYNKHQNFSRVYTAENIQESNIEFDYFVTGSDQVWNFSHTNNDWNYVLDFVRDDKEKLLMQLVWVLLILNLKIIYIGRNHYLRLQFWLYVNKMESKL